MMTKTCEHCHRLFEPRSAKARFCGNDCYLLWREAQANPSPAAVARRKEARRSRLTRKWLRNQVSGQEFERQRAFWQEHDLWE